MAQTLRCFVGVGFPVSKAVRSLLSSFEEMGRAVRGVPDENLHVTLKFLGDVDANDVRDVSAAMHAACEGFEPFELNLEGLGTFPNERRPTTVWLGVGEGAEPLAALAESMEAQLGPLGFPREKRAFTPHVTVARIKARPPEDLFDRLERDGERPWGRVKIREVVLYESTLARSGPSYAPLSTRKLKG